MPVGRRHRNRNLGDRILDAGVSAMRRGKVFPGESTLAEMFAISRPALREALARLEESGMIFRRQGASTVLNEAALELAGRFDQFGEFSDIIVDAGMQPKLELIEAHIQRWSESRHGSFKAKPAYVLRSVKRWLADGAPVRATVDTVPLPDDIDSSLIDGATSVLKVVSQLYGEAVAWEIAVPTAVLATTEAARWLGVRRGAPLLKLQTIGLTVSGKEGFYSSDYHVPGLIPQGIIRVIR